MRQLKEKYKRIQEDNYRFLAKNHFLKMHIDKLEACLDSMTKFAAKRVIEEKPK